MIHIIPQQTNEHVLTCKFPSTLNYVFQNTKNISIKSLPLVSKPALCVTCIPESLRLSLLLTPASTTKTSLICIYEFGMILSVKEVR